MRFAPVTLLLVSGGPQMAYRRAYVRGTISPAAVNRNLTTMTARSLHTTLGLDLLPSSVLETPEGGCSKDVQSKQANLYTAQMSDVVHAYPFELSQFRVPGPPEVYYIANFVTREEERYLLRKISESPRQKWKQLANRRLQIWGGEIGKNVLFESDMPSYISEQPNLLDRLRATGAFESSPHGIPNHVILNEYLAGQGIMPHEDGPSYHPIVATLSLGSHAVFHYYQYSEVKDSGGSGRALDKTPILSLVLEPRSVVVTRSSLYTSCLHGIEEREEDLFRLDHNGHLVLEPGSAPIANRHLLTEGTLTELQEGGGRIKRETRYSLTCRDVARVMRVKKLVGR